MPDRAQTPPVHKILASALVLASAVAIATDKEGGYPPPPGPYPVGPVRMPQGGAAPENGRFSTPDRLPDRFGEQLFGSPADSQERVTPPPQRPPPERRPPPMTSPPPAAPAAQPSTNAVFRPPTPTP